MTVTNKPVARVEEHLQKLRKAGLDTQAFFAALVDIRDDTTLSTPHREALYQTIAMESFLWYLDAINGAPIDREKAGEAARKLAEANAAAIEAHGPDERPTGEQPKTAASPPPREKSKKGPSPKSGVTKVERPPKKK